MAVGPRLAREMSRRRLFGLSIVFAAICLIVAAIMPQIALAVAFVIGVGFGAGAAYLAGATLMGTDIEDEVRGRVFALLQSLIRIVLIASLAAVPFIVGGVGKNTFRIGDAHLTVDGTRFVLVAGGLLALLAGVLAYRKMDEREQTPLWADVKESFRGDAVARRRIRRGALFVAFEGGEGAGKSTQAKLLASTLRDAGRAVTVTHEPGATEVGAKIRAVLLDGTEPVTARAEALLFAADRAQHIDAVIRPALAANQVVITDRFVDSSLAYQGAGRRLSMEAVRRLSRWATEGLRPDLTVMLDLPAEEGLTRAGNRGTSDRLERESLEFHERVRMSFRSLAESAPRRYLVVDATAPADQIAAQVLAAVEGMLHPKRTVLRPSIPASTGG
jgi:dTMP kinase